MKRLTLFSYSALFSTLSLLLLADTTANATQPLERTRLPLPELAASPAQKSLSTSSQYSDWQVHSVQIQKNDTLSEALDRLHIDTKTSYLISKTANSHLLTNLRVKDKLSVWLDTDGNLQKILYPKSRTHHIELTRQDDGFQIKEIHLPIETKVVTTAGTIQNSFYLSGEQAGLSPKTIMNLADIFSWEIDFIRELRTGDPFKVIYEQQFLEGEYIGDGEILAAEIVTEGKYKHNAFLLKDKKGESLGYFDDSHKSLKKAFLRNPVDYVRITSRYTPKRFHPVQKKWKAHRGVDYGGPVGTPIRVTGNGKIIKRYHSPSYGNVIFVQHAGKYTTVYAHLSRFGKYRVGQYVKQGQVIGYLGQTGWASGPHLHYEFRVNGRFRDPLKVKFPDAGPVPKEYRTQFQHYANLMSSHMDRLNPYTQLASHFE